MKPIRRTAATIAIDPTNVTRLALRNAASIASLVFTTDCVIAEPQRTQPRVQSALAAS